MGSRGRECGSECEYEVYGHAVALLRWKGRLRRLRLGVFVAFVVLMLDLVVIMRNCARQPSVYHPPESEARMKSWSLSHERIYIAALHWNDEALLRNHWIPSILDLVSHIPPGNVYISILESGSWDDTKGALRELGAELDKRGVENSIILENRTHEDVINEGVEAAGEGLVWTPRGKQELRRIPYLAKERNKAMENLNQLAKRDNGPRRTFDKVLWLNDVIFTTEQVETLLGTNHDSYAAACALDFSESHNSLPKFYDSFAVRDSQGHAAVSLRWPFFLSRMSRSAVLRFEPVLVQSCWNGMVVFDAAPFYSTGNGAGLKFRGIPDDLAALHIEASECCLIHVDNTLSATQGVFINPNVRVAYKSAANAIVNPGTEHDWPDAWGKVKGVWANRWARWMWWSWRRRDDIVIAERMKRWREQGRAQGIGNEEKGRPCLVDEMQVLVDNGWKHL